MPEIQVLLGDRTGRVLAEVTPKLSNIPWRLNEIPRITLKFSKKDDKATQTNLQYGNRVFIRFSSDIGLPDWGGVIDTPATWDASSISLSVYGIQYLLQFRQTIKTRVFNETIVGRIFDQVLREAEQQQALRLRVGPVWTGGRVHTVRYHFKSAWSIITDSIQQIETCDVRFIPKYQNGFIRFEAELHEKAGSDKSSQFAFKEGRNVSEVVYTEQGPIINEFAAVGKGTTWSDKKSARYYNRKSDQKYGLRQSSKVFPDVTLEYTLARNARVEVIKNAEPHTRIALTVSNTTPARFVDYDLGDIVRCILPSYSWDGYDAPVRVLAREYVPSKGCCILVVEEDKFIAPINIGTGAERTEE